MQAGTYRINITPPIGYRMQGHDARTKPASGVHDPLQAKFLTLFDGERRVAVVTMDLIYLSREDDTRIRQHVAEQAGIGPESLVIACSHTHTGPYAMARGENADQYLPAYFDLLCEQIRSGVQLAIRNEQPARLSSGSGDVNIGMVNRRLKTPKGVIMARNEQGPVDLTTPVLRVDDQQGQPLAVLFQYACHPTTLGTDIDLISADYPGVAQREIEKAFPGAIALHMTGCCGDVRPAIAGPGQSFAGGSFEDIERMGRLLACHVIACCATATPSKSSQVHAGRVEHLYKFDRQFTPTSLDQLDDIAGRLKQRDPAAADQIDQWQQQWAQRLSDPHAARPDKGAVGYVQALQLGDVALIALPGEIMAEFALNLRRRLSGPPALIASYTQAAMGYIPTREAMCEGGYEAHSFLSRGWPPFAPTMPQSLVKTTVDLVKSLTR